MIHKILNDEEFTDWVNNSLGMDANDPQDEDEKIERKLYKKIKKKLEQSYYGEDIEEELEDIEYPITVIANFGNNHDKAIVEELVLRERKKVCQK